MFRKTTTPVELTDEQVAAKKARRETVLGYVYGVAGIVIMSAASTAASIAVANLVEKAFDKSDDEDQTEED